MAQSMMGTTPTEQAYNELRAAYDFFLHTGRGKKQKRRVVPFRDHQTEKEGGACAGIVTRSGTVLSAAGNSAKAPSEAKSVGFIHGISETRHAVSLVSVLTWDLGVIGGEAP